MAQATTPEVEVYRHLKCCIKVMLWVDSTHNLIFEVLYYTKSSKVTVQSGNIWREEIPRKPIHKSHALLRTKPCITVVIDKHMNSYQINQLNMQLSLYLTIFDSCMYSKYHLVVQKHGSCAFERVENSEITQCVTLIVEIGVSE